MGSLQTPIISGVPSAGAKHWLVRLPLNGIGLSLVVLFAGFRRGLAGS